jgi:hypothetical protein
MILIENKSYIQTLFSKEFKYFVSYYRSYAYLHKFENLDQQDFVMYFMENKGERSEELFHKMVKDDIMKGYLKETKTGVPSQ